MKVFIKYKKKSCFLVILFCIIRYVATREKNKKIISISGFRDTYLQIIDITIKQFITTIYIIIYLLPFGGFLINQVVYSGFKEEN